MYKHQISYLVPLGFFAGLFLIYQILMRMGIVPALLFSLLPVLALIGFGILQKHYIYYAYFALNYIIMGASRYVPMKSGLIMLAFTFFLLLVLISRNLFEKQEWKRCNNFLTWSWLIWFLYCGMEILNPRALWEPWTIAMPNYAIYPLACAIIVPLLFTKYKHFQWLLIIWAGLTLLAAAKGYWQRNHGFDAAEWRWLFVEGGKRTHLIVSGIRFFSFFSDAASYGASMGVSMVVFGISAFYNSNRKIQILFLITSVAAAYGLIISGTRSDLAIPFVGLGVFLILCRNIKGILISAILLTATYFFLNHTTIGDDNRLIRRMRSVFNREDASWMARVSNKQKIYKLMEDKPFGVGLGLAGAKAQRFRPVSESDPLTYLATDSWYIMTFVETGIVGIILYTLTLVSILMKASYLSLFKIKNRQLQGQLYAIIAAIAGILTSCYANELLNYPNGIIVYTLMAILFVAPYYNQELQSNESKS